jgi:hypothetical protein
MAPVVLTVRAEYAVPERLPVTSNAFVPVGGATTISLTLPTMYAGRILISVFSPAGRTDAFDFSLTKVDVFQRPQQKRSLEPSAFSRDAQGRFVSPLVFLS